MELNRKKSRRKKVDVKKKILLIIIFVIINAFLIVSFVKINEAVNINQLNNRFYELLDISFTSDDYNDKTTTTGKYKTVESAMNKYFIDYSNKTKEVLDIVNSDKFKSLLSIDNYGNGIESVKANLDYINKTKNDLNNRFTELYNYSSEDYIKTFIHNISDDEKVNKLFFDYIYSIDANDHFDECNSLLKIKQNEVNNILDISKQVFEFLVANEGKWLVKDGQIQFANNSLKEQYDGYISKIK